MKGLKYVLKRIIGFPNRVCNSVVLKYNAVTIGKNWRILGRIFVKSFGRISIGDDVIIRSAAYENPIGCGNRTYLQVLPNAELSIGNFVGMSNVAITCANRVTIEDYVMIGSGARLFDTDFHSLSPAERMRGHKENVHTAPILVKKHAFLGADCMILKGVTIGENAIIGAGAVVTRSVPDNQVWAGNPAQFVKDVPVSNEEMNKPI